MNILFFLTPKKEVAYIPASDTLRQALEKMRYHGYTAVPMLTKEGKYAGTITEGDILRAMQDFCNWSLEAAEKVKILDIHRRRDNQSILIDTDMNDLVDVIMDQNFVPVNDDQGNFIGIVTRKDVIQFYYNEYKKVNQPLREQE
ncbi:CBS domain-containing protein [Anaerostipes faecalis]|uniref:CBS domain-containing protein n=1 Tax=Anaerostipes faecalis TaxID=2738446 RepID=UPI003F056D29